MPNMNQVMRQVRELLDQMDPAAKQSLVRTVRQSISRGGDPASIVRQVLLGLDPVTRHRFEQQLGVRIDPQTLETLDADGLNQMMGQIFRNR